MHREAFLKVLSEYSGENRDAHVHFLNFVRRESQCFHRETQEGHVTGSAWLLSPDLRSVLLTQHRKLKKWLQLGGHADGDADVLAVALKEAEEESGLVGIEPITTDIFDLDVHEIPERKGEPAHLHYDARFLLRAPSLDFKVSDESENLAWVRIDELPHYCSEESMLRMHRLWRNWLAN